MASCFQPRPTLRSLQTLNPTAAPGRPPHHLRRRCTPAGVVSCGSAAAPPRRRYSVTILPGDGMGPEVVSVARDVLSLAGSREGIEFRFQEMPMGGAALDAVGVPLPKETLSVAKDSDAVLLGAIGGYKWDNNEKSLKPETGLLQLRAGLGVFANLRPATVLPQLVDSSTLKKEVAEGVDLMVGFISENQGVLGPMKMVKTLVSILKCILSLRLKESPVLHLKLLKSDVENCVLLTRQMYWRHQFSGGEE